MEKDCPDSEIWVAWWEDRLAPAARVQWASHLTACEGCRMELASLAKVSPARKAARTPWIRYAAAAGVVLAAWGLARSRGGKEAPPSAQTPLVQAEKGLSWSFGRTGEVVLAPGSRGRFQPEEGMPSLRLENGVAVVEASGDPVRVAIADVQDRFEVEDGVLAVWTRSGKPLASLFLEAAHADGSSWGAQVLKGWVVQVAGGVRTTLKAGTRIGEGSFEDFRGWREEPGRSGVFRNASRTLLGVPAGVAECRVRKLDPKAEAALLFRSGGKGWKAPLGVNLPGDGGWIRLRLELDADRVRLVAAGREYFSVHSKDLGSVAQPASQAEALALQAWGGDVEVEGLRWKGAP